LKKSIGIKIILEKASFLRSLREFSVTLLKITTLKKENKACIPKSTNSAIATLVTLFKSKKPLGIEGLDGLTVVPRSFPIKYGKTNPALVDKTKNIHPMKYMKA
jgi:hypothetical protein